MRKLLDVEQAQASWPASSAATSRSTSPSCRPVEPASSCCKLGLFLANSHAPVNEVRFPATRATTRPSTPTSTRHRTGPQEDLRRVHDRRGLGQPAPAGDADQGRQGVPQAQAQRATSPPRSRGSSRRAPRARTWPCSPNPASSTSRSTSRRCARPARATRPHEPRLYTIRTRHGKPPGLPARALRRRVRRVLRRPGHDLALPADPRRPRRHRARSTAASSSSTTTARTCGSSPGGRKRAVYWVTNTLSQSIPNEPPDRDRRLRCGGSSSRRARGTLDRLS